MRRLALLLVLLTPAACQVDPDTEPRPIEPRLEQRATMLVKMALEGQAYDLLTELTRTAPARLSGSPAAARAVAWAKQTMQRLGLAHVRLQKVMVPHWVRGEVEKLTFAGEQLPILALGGSIGTPRGGVTGELIVVRSFEELHALGEKARGKIVLFDRPMQRSLFSTFRAYGGAVPQRTSGAVEAAKVGALAALVRSMTTRLDDTPHTGVMHYAEGVHKVPTAAVSTRAAELLASRVAAGEKVRVTLELSCKTLPDVESANVIGEIVGTEPSEIVVIGGHLDAWDVAQGAHDDGAGCVHCLEAARLIMAAGIRPRRTIRVVLFMNEENGLRGGQAYARAARSEAARHVAAIESDSGGFQPRLFSTSAKGKRLARLERLLEPMRPFGIGPLASGGGGADISPLRAQGVELFGLRTAGQRYFDYHHSRRDTLEAVNERELALGAAAVAYLASVLAG